MKVLEVERFTKHRASSIINFCHNSMSFNSAGCYHNIFDELEADDIELFIEVDGLMVKMGV